MNNIFSSLMLYDKSMRNTVRFNYSAYSNLAEVIPTLGPVVNLLVGIRDSTAMCHHLIHNSINLELFNNHG